MLELKRAALIRDAINRKVGNDVVSLEDAARMEPITVTTDGSAYTVLALQKGDLTILTWIQINDLGMKVRKVKKVAW